MSNSELNNCFKNGKYYNPSTSHYNNPSTNVMCDRCHTNNLPVSIGYGQIDLCMQCVFEMSKINSKPKVAKDSPIDLTWMLQGKYNPEEQTLMCQSMFESESFCSTDMEQNMYNKKSKK